ncbi:MAG: hypothetical protein ACO4AG_12280, partial [Candidatus Nanopelagicales bacterium]
MSPRSLATFAVAACVVASGLVLTAPSSAQQSSPTSAQSDSSPRADIWQTLRTGRGYAVLLRHALAPGTGDPAGFRLGDCSTQRNLSLEGRRQAIA